MSTLNHQASLDKLTSFFESVSLASVEKIHHVYTEDAYFKDPFNEVHGIHHIRRIFEHMFVQVGQPRFVITSTVLQGDTAFLCWDFLFTMKRFHSDEQCIRGATHIRFATDGRVMMHRDYWDAAEELYEKLPLLGSLMRFLKRTANK
ncbi:nuclear transport factor 2 family protein [Undibacterium oligocarboniphilum]|uniref:Nuclear transport factor 2 family protein n=1 Tax=Undibacterium oligocarboniphilum TaxID=666702 RepID=A0A850QHY2_9BURK|nr:nuclear transport factor 2 family protein [Undibacterium oligocarboniphilum]MBC3871007.1 nuclear transport factor 2 family protein [Undibacterium oligocarboniphilum]NVO76370.1 nuclear transport factor 2 family protein [Undibacterium oligocarboniphilum]